MRLQVFRDPLVPHGSFYVTKHARAMRWDVTTKTTLDQMRPGIYVHPDEDLTDDEIRAMVSR